MVFPSGAEIVGAIPIIISLIIIEGLLSVDNALAIAAVAARLPGEQKYQALRYGIIGAYLFRGLALAFAAYIIANPWLRILGAVYLLYLMCKNLGFAEEAAEGARLDERPNFLLTILQIELLDLSLSIDNVVAAVAFSSKLWIVCTGVFIGILALRFLAGYCIRLLEIFPILGKTAFLLIGYVGFILAYEEVNRLSGSEVHVSSAQKFIGIVLIISATLLYSRSSRIQRIVQPIAEMLLVPMRFFARGFDAVAFPVTWAIGVWGRRKSAPQM